MAPPPSPGTGPSATVTRGEAPQASEHWAYIADIPRPGALHQFVEATAERTPHATALECAGELLTYREFDEAGNRLARHLWGRGIRPGSVVGILVDRSVAMYVAILGALKAGACYVPIDPKSPHDRVAYIVKDAGVSALLTTRDRATSSDGVGVERVWLDSLRAQLATGDGSRIDLSINDESAAYIIYTSGSTGRPKGVAVSHRSICNFVVVASEVYGVTARDRVYQGLSISFDFSLEELWTTWAKGATLVAGPTDGRQVGPELADFLEQQRITFLHAVPTVLSTMDRTLPLIRTLNLGGEPCPQELVERWGAPDRRILNTYGPTECTSSCTWAELRPGVPVTIGTPLPTYTCTLRDEDFAIVPDGEVGELCIGGIGVALGYIGLPAQTAEKFVIDERGERVYRTGDLGRYDENGNIVYMGRKDAEVKVRGHRVDLGEIESTLLQSSLVSSAVVSKLDVEGTGGELVAYLLLAGSTVGTRELATRLRDHCRSQLPAYMVPDYVEFVDEIPLMPSGKADRSALPPPVHPRLVHGSNGRHSSPRTATERWMTEAWAEAFRLPADQISTRADFFTDLGGHSLLAATLVSRLRSSGRPGTQDLSIPDLYANPTVQRLSAFLDREVAAGPGLRAATTAVSRQRYSRLRIVAFGALQVLYIYFAVLLAFAPTGVVYSIHAGVPSFDMLLQMAATLPVSYLVARWLLPVITARLSAPGITPGEHPLYGRVHLRVWLIQRAVGMSPLEHLSGSHLMAPYLRLLGARIGEACHIGTAHIALPPVVEVGDDVTIGYGTHLRGFEIQNGMLRIGHIRLRDRANIGANCVLTGPCSVGDEAIVRAQSLLLPASDIGAREVWAGSPASLTRTANDPAIDAMIECHSAPREWPRLLTRRMSLGVVFLEILPMLAMLPIIGIVWWTLLTYDDRWALVATAVSGPLFVLTTCGLILWFRRFALLDTPVGIHHLRSELGVEKWFGDKLLEASLELTNSLYGTLYTPHWLRLLGAKVGKGTEIATIANIDPDLLTLKDDSFVADMASIGSATYANGHVAFRRTIVNSRAFVGNASFVPSGSNLGENSLIGVLTKPPVGGAPRGTSWLGSPPIFLPNREMYDEFGEASTFRPPRRKVIARYIIEFFRTTLPASILGLSAFFTLWMLAFLARTWDMWSVVLITGVVALTGSVLVTLLVAAIKWLLVGRYRPRVEPLWGNFVRRTEFVTGIFETTAVPALLALIQGTPLLGPVLRLYGARIGRRSLLDTTYVTEFDLIHVGDDVAVGHEVSLQTHLFEDRVMKMGVVALEDGASVGSRAVVLYGATVGEDASVDPFTLVMKGESLPPNTRWAGIPARRRRHELTSAVATGTPESPQEVVDAVEEPPAPTAVAVAEDIVDVPHVLEEVPASVSASADRIVGIDIARGIALIGMMVVHLLSDVTDDGSMTWWFTLASGNSAALFATLAGVGIALSTGRSRPHSGRKYAAGVVALVVRAAVIGIIGLALGLVVPASVAAIILPYYALLFLLAIPFLRVPPVALGTLSLIMAVAIPVWSHFARQSLPVAPEAVNFTFLDVIQDPAGVGTQLLLTGVYPAIPWVAYIALGIALGRVRPRRLIGLMWMVGGGVLALLASMASWILLRPMGGIQELAEVAQDYMSLDKFTTTLVWGAGGTLPTDTPWWLAVRAPHTTTPLDLLYTMGVAMAVLGACIIVNVVVPGVFRPLSTMGSMPLTMYSLHLLMSTALEWPDWVAFEFWLQVMILMAFALLWSRRYRRGPLEEVVNAVVKVSRRPFVQNARPRHLMISETPRHANGARVG